MQSFGNLKLLKFSHHFLYILANLMKFKSNQIASVQTKKVTTFFFAINKLNFLPLKTSGYFILN